MNLPFMKNVHHLAVFIMLVPLLSASQYNSQSPGSSVSDSRALDALLQDYAYQAFVNPRTGVPSDGKIPSNLTGIKIAAMRLRTGSLKRRGVKSYKEFGIPVGVVVQPYVERVVLVYQNLGNWSSFYYPLAGYTYLTPLLGLLVYDAANLNAIGLPELDFVASGSPLYINFTNVIPLPSGVIAKCVWYGFDGSPQLRDLISPNVCSTFRQGHFSIVINSSEIPYPPPNMAPEPVPSPEGGGKSKKSNVWKIVGSVIGGFFGFILLAFIIVFMVQYRQKRKVTEMEKRADAGEALRTARVGYTQAPVAMGTRTQPVLENEYTA